MPWREVSAVSLRAEFVALANPTRMGPTRAPCAANFKSARRRRTNSWRGSQVTGRPG
jgi:hypothetical protein